MGLSGAVDSCFSKLALLISSCKRVGLEQSGHHHCLLIAM